MARSIRNFATVGEASDLPTVAAARAYKGAKSGEPIFDGTRVRMQDGVRNGGHPTAVCTRQELTANGTVNSSSAFVAIKQLTAALVVSLPAAADYEPGQPLYIADETGLCSWDTGLTITISAAGSDKIAGQASITIGGPYQKIVLHSNGSNLWTF